jgi:sulfur-oxidizing protein SoxY
MFYAGAVLAEASDKIWPVMKESFFAGKTIEDGPFIKLEAPARAESGAQVPLTLTIDKPLTGADAIKKVYLLVDANPIQLTAIYNFTPLSGKAQIDTRIRMETDSYVRAVGETADGKLYMSAIVIRAAGGCGGPLEVNLQEVRAKSGKIKMSVEDPVKKGEVNAATFHIKHPMMTGLQRDLATGGYWPAFFINKATFTYNGQTLLDADFGVGVSEDPYLRFNFVPDAPGKLEVKAADNEGRFFSHAVDVSL